jgi:hypothetical protein
MIRTHQIQRKADEILIGIALDNAVLDFVTNAALIRNCLKLLGERHQGAVRPQIGNFGNYAVAINIDNANTVSLFVDGPYFEMTRNMSAALWLGKEELQRLLAEALQCASSSRNEEKGDAARL